jgi:hypothetical protein
MGVCFTGRWAPPSRACATTAAAAAAPQTAAQRRRSSSLVETPSRRVDGRKHQHVQCRQGAWSAAMIFLGGGQVWLGKHLSPDVGLTRERLAARLSPPGVEWLKRGLRSR